MTQQSAHPNIKQFKLVYPPGFLLSDFPLLHSSYIFLSMFIAHKPYHSSQASIKCFERKQKTFPNLFISCSQTPPGRRQFTINTLWQMQRCMKVIRSLWLSWSLENKQTADSIPLKKKTNKTQRKHNKPTKPPKTKTEQTKKPQIPHHCPLSLISNTSQVHHNDLSSTSPLKHKHKPRVD